MRDDYTKPSCVFGNTTMIIVAFLTAASYIGGLIGVDAIVSFSFILSIGIVLGLSIADIMIRTKLDPWLLIVLFFMVLAVIYSGIVMDFDYYKGFLITLCTFVCISYAPKLRVNEKTRKVIRYTFLAVALVTLVMFYLLGYKTKYFESTEAIAFNFSNPNAAGLWVTGVLLINSCFLFEQKRFLKITYYLVIAGLLHVIFSTESRNSLFAAVAFLTFLVLYRLGKNKKTPKVVLFVAVVAPIIIFFVYMYAILPIASQVEGVLGMDKGVDTREMIWQSVLDKANEFMPLGRYDLYHGENLHNSLLTLLGTYGLPLMLSACWLMYRSAVMIQENISSLAAMAFCSIMLSGCFEASIFVGIGGFYLAVLVITACFSNSDAFNMYQGNER